MTTTSEPSSPPAAIRSSRPVLRLVALASSLLFLLLPKSQDFEKVG